MKLRQKLKLSEKENRELKKKLAERDQTTSERKILVVLAILQIISTILEIIEKILNFSNKGRGISSLPFIIKLI